MSESAKIILLHARTSAQEHVTVQVFNTAVFVSLSLCS